MGVVWVRRRRRIWLRISPGSSRKRKGIAASIGCSGRPRYNAMDTGSISGTVGTQLISALMKDAPGK